MNAASTLGFDSLTNIGSGAVVVLIVVSILKGWLVPRRTLRDIVAEKDKTIKGLAIEKSDWKSAAQTKDATISTLSSQLDEALESARVARDVMSAIPKPRKAEDDG